MADALALVAERPASPARARALAQRCSFAMLAGDFARAIEVGAEALELAERLELHELCARAHIAVGCARCCVGDVGGLAEIEAAIAIGREAGAPETVEVGHGNLSSELFFLGRLKEARVQWREAHEISRRYGFAMLDYHESGRAAWAFADGDWDEALRVAGRYLGGGKEGLRYADPAMIALRAWVRLARGDAAGADADSAEAAAQARGSDAQARAQAMSVRAAIALAVGRPAEAAEPADALVALGPVLLPALNEAFPTFAMPAWALRDLGRADDLATLLRATPIESPWMDAAWAIARDDFVRAADILAAMGHGASAAYARLRAGIALTADGRAVEAQAQLAQATAFHRRAGATAFLEATGPIPGAPTAARQVVP
jgi:tetratricopeptide (TPR) repeat protein